MLSGEQLNTSRDKDSVHHSLVVFDGLSNGVRRAAHSGSAYADGGSRIMLAIAVKEAIEFQYV